MVYSGALKTYQKTSVETADTVQLIIMCYDAVIQDLEAAQDLHQSRSIEATYVKIRHAQDLITELLVGLDYEQGGQIAHNLGRLYNFILRELIGINSKQGTTVYGPLIHILSELKEAWVQVRQSAPLSMAPGMALANRNRGVMA